ncbi:ribosomal RNA small subunit methyltransferase NEP1 [Drosophila biarmipes]|uniref:ribosomal RNA small subunit methyltransferase NEP1 n=1 Tax=Drosophila biarmipes TaxID=125945 RepID=UPI0007E7DD42|nr:ribosomal RNA small subunit methyltransferase NEP1 [Drosophila biarmipes]
MADNEEVNLDRGRFKIVTKNTSKNRLIVVLEGAQLEVVKVNDKLELLNCDDHLDILRQSQRDPATVRPDITLQTLTMLYDSPLHRAGYLQVFVHTEKGVLIEVSQQTLIPRTFKGFGPLIVKLLTEGEVRAKEDPSLKLMRVIQNPISDHLPVGCKRYALSAAGKPLRNLGDLVPKEEEPVVVVMGSYAFGNLTTDLTEEFFSVSSYPLAANDVCSRLASAFAAAWGVF